MTPEREAMIFIDGLFSIFGAGASTKRDPIRPGGELWLCETGGVSRKNKCKIWVDDGYGLGFFICLKNPGFTMGK